MSQFSAMTAFDMVRNQVFGISWRLPTLLKGLRLLSIFSLYSDPSSANVSFKRLHEFLYETELLDEFTKENFPALVTELTEPARPDVIGLSNATFAWSASVVNGTLTPSNQGFRLRVQDELLFKRNAINLIIGPTGSGKTSLLMALLGEMHYVPSGPGAFMSLPREGGVAYAAQESWVLNETIRVGDVVDVSSTHMLIVNAGKYSVWILVRRGTVQEG
jgi:ABC-type multidrug transport system fused ATPase/permease subunit